MAEHPSQGQSGAEFPRRDAGWRRLGFAAVIVVLVAGLAGAAAASRLAMGPVSLPFLNDRVAAALTGQMPAGLEVAVGDTVLHGVGRNGVRLGLDRVVIANAAGDRLLAAPELSVSLSASALALGRIAPTELWLVRPELTLGEGTAVPATAPGGGLSMLTGLLGGPAGLDRAGVREGRIVVPGDDDAASRGLGPIDVVVSRGEEGAVSFAAELGDLPGGPHVAGSLSPTEAGGYRLSARLRDLAAPDVEALLPADWSGLYTGPISSELTITLDAAGKPRALAGTVAVGAGHLGGGRMRWLVDEADFDFEWSAATGTFTLHPSRVLVGHNQATVAGSLTVPRAGDFDAGRTPLRLKLIDVYLGDPRGSDPAIYPSIELDAVYLAPQGVLRIDRLDVAAAQAAMSMIGVIGDEQGESPSLRLAGSMVPMPYAALKELWPPFLAADTRKWVFDNLSAGEITGAELAVDIDAGDLAAALRGATLPERAYSLEFGLEDVVFSYLGEMPPIAGADGRARLTPRSFELDMAPGAQIALDSGETVEVGRGRFHVDALHEIPVIGRVMLDVGGSTSALARLFDHPPLNAASGRGLDPARVAGRGELSIDITIPLIRELEFENVGLVANGTLDGFAAEGLFGAEAITDGQLRVAIAERRVKISGQATLDGMPAQIALDEPLDGGEGAASAVSLRLDDAERRRLGMPLDGLISGPVTASLTNSKDSVQAAQRVEADLTEARVDVPFLGLDKPRGEAATASFLLERNGESVRITDFRLESASVRLQGEAEFGTGGTLVRLDLPAVRTARGVDVAVSGRTENGMLAFNVRGPVLDLRPTLRRLGDSGVEAASPLGVASPGRNGGVRVDFEVDEVRGLNGTSLSGVRGGLVQDGAGVSRLELTAATSAGGRVHLRYGDGGQQADLALETEDGGRVLAWSGIYPNMRGGSMRLNAMRSSAQGPLTGQVVINGFTIADDPALTRLIESSAQGHDQRSGAAAQQGSISPSSVGFDTLRLPFERHAGSVRIADGVLRGRMVGATISGDVDFDRDRLGLSGTYIPLYGINNLFGRLPVLGALLGGGRNEGLLGITYSVSGPLAEPVLTINPLSMVAPGVLRYVLGMDNPGATSPRNSGMRETDPTIMR